MCGIAGIFHNAARSMLPELRTLLEALRHRGYSRFEMDEGPHWALGANRLEIVDPGNGRQPAYSRDRQVSVVFNGEIYNYKALKENLIRDGYVFQTDTDTEVIAQGYHRWGNDLFARLNGMFAIILHDAKANTFVAARDPVGVKPLYFVNTSKMTVFASEIKALLHIPGEIQMVSPGHYLDGRGMTVCYDFRCPIAVSSGLGINAETFRTLFSESVRKRVQTDLPIAVFLSGGIDSGSVLYEAVRHHPHVTAFSIGKPGAEDVEAARALCKELNTPFVHIPVTDSDLLRVVPETIRTIESFEPNHIRGGTLSYLLSQKVAEAGYRIALCGEGADELFGGYREFGLAILNGARENELRDLFDRFLRELHKTQLQRVDRTSMRFTLEVREPYLDKEVLDFACSLPVAQKVALIKPGKVADKRILREAYRGILPRWLIEREKAVLSLGAGFGSNGPEGLFFEYGEQQVSVQKLKTLQQHYPEYHIRNQEEAYYFDIFLETFGDLALAKERPLVNAAPVGA